MGPRLGFAARKKKVDSKPEASKRDMEKQAYKTQTRTCLFLVVLVACCKARKALVARRKNMTIITAAENAGRHNHWHMISGPRSSAKRKKDE